MVFELVDLEQYPTMNFTVENWTYLDPKGHPICAVKDIFGMEWEEDAYFGKADEITKEIVLCMPHEPAAVPMQRCDAVGESGWWMYCKKCGNWMHPHTAGK
jgi:hypothetical protein